jgi:5-methylcytosine-specific restriction enzyme subunit McrC
VSGTPDHLPTYTLGEWKSRDLPLHQLDQHDRRLVASLGGDNPTAHLGMAELRTGLRVTARSWVGVVRFSSFEVRVVPKLVGGNLGLVRLVDYASGLGALSRHPGVHMFEAGGSSLLDLVALLLAEACEAIVRTGLRGDYQELEEDLPVLRGRLLADRQWRRRLGRVDRLECRFDEHTTNTVDNQLLLAAVSACAARVRHPGVSVRIRRLRAILGEACFLDGLDLRELRSQLTYDRMNEHYREGHALAWLVFDGLGINDLFSRGSGECFAFLIDMNAQFEGFVTRWLGRLLGTRGYRVTPQRQDRSVIWDAIAGQPYTHVRPDLMIECLAASGHFLPVDAKYKLYGEKGICPEDVYQSFVYAFAYSPATRPPLPCSVLVYPSLDQAPERIHLHVRRSGGPAGAELVAVGIDLISALAEAERGIAGETGRAIVDLVAAKLPPACVVQ